MANATLYFSAIRRRSLLCGAAALFAVVGASGAPAGAQSLDGSAVPAQTAAAPPHADHGAPDQDGPDQGGPDQPIVVGLAAPMAGASFSVGRQYLVGVTAAWEATGGKALGRDVQIRALDDACNEQLAAAAARTLVEIKAAAVIGHSCSAATLAAAPIYAAAGIPQITPASTNPKVTEQGIATLFRMIGRDDRQATIAADRLAARHGGERIALIYAANAYGQGLGEAMRREMQRVGLTPVLTETFATTQDSYLPLVERLLKAGTQVLYVVGGALDTGMILRQVRQMGGNFPIIGPDSLMTDVFSQAAGPYAEGVRFTFPPEPARLPAAAGAAAAIRARDLEPIGYTLLAYAAYEVWRTGTERAGGVDGRAVTAAIRSAPVDTVLGPVSFDAKGDVLTGHPPFVWYEWRDGKRVPAAD